MMQRSIELVEYVPHANTSNTSSERLTGKNCTTEEKVREVGRIESLPE